MPCKKSDCSLPCKRSFLFRKQSDTDVQQKFLADHTKTLVLSSLWCWGDVCFEWYVCRNFEWYVCRKQHWGRCICNILQGKITPPLSCAEFLCNEYIHCWEEGCIGLYIKACKAVLYYTSQYFICWDFVGMTIQDLKSVGIDPNSRCHKPRPSIQAMLTH